MSFPWDRLFLLSDLGSFGLALQLIELSIYTQTTEINIDLSSVCSPVVSAINFIRVVVFGPSAYYLSFLPYHTYLIAKLTTIWCFRSIDLSSTIVGLYLADCPRVTLLVIGGPTFTSRHRDVFVVMRFRGSCCSMSPTSFISTRSVFRTALSFDGVGWIDFILNSINFLTLRSNFICLKVVSSSN